MEIYLVRHTSPSIPKGVIYGRTDVSLADTFPDEAKSISTKLPAKLERIYSSPSSRCTLLAQQFGETLILDERLLEVNFGLWEGKTWDTVNQAELAIWMKDFVNVSPPGGESMAMMHRRVMTFWKDILFQDKQKVGIFTHGGVIRLLVAMLRELPLERAFEVKVNYGDVFLVRPYEFKNNCALLT